MIQKGKLKLYTDSEARDRLFGLEGSAERREFEKGLAAVLLGSQVGEIVRTVRKERNMSQREFGELLGVQPSQVSKIEKGLNMTFESFSKVCHALGLQAEINIRGLGRIPV